MNFNFEDNTIHGLPVPRAFASRKLYFLNGQLFQKLCMIPILFLDLLLDDLDANSWLKFYLSASKFEQDLTNAKNKDFKAGSGPWIPH